MPLYDKQRVSVPKVAIVGSIGPNGTDKATLLNMVTGKLLPTSGTFQIGNTVITCHVDQSREVLNDKHTVFEEITGGQDAMPVNGLEMQSRRYVGRFNFRGPDQQKIVGTLSGGERNRVHLAKLLASGANLLMLDEPTNDLDVETLRALEEAILDFPGCVVVVSHDRWFLDRIATHMLAFEGHSEIVWFDGNYSEYEQDYKRRHSQEIKSVRIRYRPLKT